MNSFIHIYSISIYGIFSLWNHHPNAGDSIEENTVLSLKKGQTNVYEWGNLDPQSGK